MNPVEAAEAIPGWCETKELTILAGWASQCRRVVEVGVYQGRSTTAMALALPPAGRLYAVDDFRGEPDRPELTPELLRAAFHANCATLLDSGRVILLDMHSLDAARLMQPLPPVDMVYIDGSHDYESVVNDLDAWYGRLRPGGRLCGHDAWQPDVRRALDERLPGWRRETDHLWVYEVPT